MAYLASQKYTTAAVQSFTSVCMHCRRPTNHDCTVMVCDCSEFLSWKSDLKEWSSWKFRLGTQKLQLPASDEMHHWLLHSNVASLWWYCVNMLHYKLPSGLNDAHVSKDHLNTLRHQHDKMSRCLETKSTSWRCGSETPALTAHMGTNTETKKKMLRTFMCCWQQVISVFHFEKKKIINTVWHLIYFHLINKNTLIN